MDSFDLHIRCDKADSVKHYVSGLDYSLALYKISQAARSWDEPSASFPAAQRALREIQDICSEYFA